VASRRNVAMASLVASEVFVTQGFVASYGERRRLCLSRSAAMVSSLVVALRCLSQLTLPSSDARIALAARFLLDIY
jgi:hypothetical protein